MKVNGFFRGARIPAVLEIARPPWDERVGCFAEGWFPVLRPRLWRPPMPRVIEERRSWR
ncbi:hypothetical protein TRIP_B40410 [uncultured Desulfatiglans sp.]|uniref:Uncharacterized protein n=1 Tax=Uncultured Desulfatiglans sp. TaxID=1748965 RepID=A0A653AF01_UNCDX|nr:hypothetical protein TRIP_B40410 [uncultured Desulfatiglans sp.]